MTCAFALLPAIGLAQHRGFPEHALRGLMVVGKTQEACVALTKAIALRDVHRQYRALVWGILAVLVLRGIMIGAGAALVNF